MPKKNMRKKNYQIKVHHISEILLSILKKRGLASKIEENALLQLWPKAVGPQIILHTKADAVKNGILFVKTISSVWVQQLHFMKEEIRQKLNQFAGKNIVKDIRFSVGHKLAETKLDDNTPLTNELFLKDRDKKMIADCTAKLADRELAVIFKRVMQVEINRRRQRENK
ncbi:MAG: hypothetical protein A2031_03485 [Deltaproteobacteria bacterium RBG_19FT_COMBO_43_11]|nr:MAG: hypothetical protein A2031_03485 [Deltaproteobacteria bacterium RBG_19FT_COMBO_43_11]